MYAYSGILTALYQREKTGKGTRVEVTMFEALAEWMGIRLNYTHFGGKRAAAQRARPRDYRAVWPLSRAATATT